ncbi:MAG: ribonucleoside-diphosphate reductase subunit alpha [Clostridiales bacterium]|nr:ribonucleoside-diphosphate reductase subunit alpha [Clostridiales bacterium]
MSKVVSSLSPQERLKDAAHQVGPDVSLDLLWERSRHDLYPGIGEEEEQKALILAARSLVEVDPAYSKVAARLLLQKLYQEVLGYRGPLSQAGPWVRRGFRTYVERGVRSGRLDERLLTLDLDKLADELRPERDNLFEYMGLQILYDRYLLHEKGERFELPQYFWMRVAMGLSLGEKDPTPWAARFYHIMSTFRFVPSTPTLFNAGTPYPQLASCFVSTVPDDLEGIFNAIKDNALLSKWAGGLGNDWTPVRALGSPIRGTNGKSQGVIPFLKVVNDTAIAVNQGGKRQGAVCAYLEVWHLDIEEFLELRRNTGDERRRTHDMNTAVWVPDLFLKRVEADGIWTLFSPVDVPDLHDLYGPAFEERYQAYEKMAERGDIPLHRQIPAKDLWRKLLTMLFETGHPWITFKDACNLRNTQDHVGVIHSSNLCTEITLNTSFDEVAVCNLGSVNLMAHATKEGLDQRKLRATVKMAVRMLDNAIDLNLYPIEKARRSNLRHRPLGLGIMGFQDFLHHLGVSYASEEALRWADLTAEMVAHSAIYASALLAKERGPYETYEGSHWHRGLLPQDTLDILEEKRGIPIPVPRGGELDWQPVRDAIRRHGLRNSHLLAIAPTATISHISGTSPSIEPAYANLFVRSNLSGEFIQVNPFLVRDLKALGLWDETMREDLKYYDGSVQPIPRVPERLKEIYRTAFEIPPEWLIGAAARRQKWIDQSQSLNLYVAEPSGKKLSQMYLTAWRMGLKTTYYLRSRAATHIEKATLDINRRQLQPLWMKSKSPTAEIVVYRDGDTCEVCQ